MSPARTNTARWLEELPNNCMPEPNTGCWFWTRALDTHGYGMTCVDRQRWRAHRLAYTLLRGPIPDGLHIDHLCRQRSCVNPAHMELVTNRENILRGNCRAAIGARKTHCSRGHALSGDNLGMSIRNGHTHRHCRECNRNNCRAWRQKDSEGSSR